MLPLDSLSPNAQKCLEEHGVKEQDILVTVSCDLDFDGNFGSSRLVFTKDTLYAFSTPAEIEQKRKTRLADKFAGPSQKPRASVTDQSLPDTPTRTPGQSVDSEGDVPCSPSVQWKEYNTDTIEKLYIDSFVSSNRLVVVIGGKTYTVTYCTNSRKQYIYAFIEIVEKLMAGKTVLDDDPIFEQFNIYCPKCGMRYKNPARKVCENCMNKGAIFKRLLAYFHDYRLSLVVMLLCMGANALLSLVSPYMSGVILYDKVLNPDASLYRIPLLGIEVNLQGQILPAVGIIFFLALCSLGVGILQNRASIQLANRVTLKMKLDIFTAMQKLSLSFFNNNQTGRLITRVNYDADRIKNFFTNGVPYLVVNAITFVSIFIILMGLNFKLTLIVLIPIPFIILIVRKCFPKLWRMNTKIWRRTSALNSFLGDSLNGVRVVKAFAKETEETDRFNYYSERLYRTNLQYNALSLTIFPVMYLLISLSGNVIWGFGGMSVMNHNMNFGELMTFIGYLGMIYGPLEFFANLTEQLTDTANSAERMFEVLDAVPDVSEAPDAVPVDIKGQITFQDVCFHYAPNRPILKNVSLTIEAGENVGLVGHTGSGKSTIVNLIMRLYDVISGSISIDGVNVKHIKTECLRKNMAIVSQEIFLFRGTIADNIRYARPDATMEEIIDAAKAANAHDFIMRFPDGYETIVGTGSRSLSGGEQQRISIARALLLNPAILILDEATAAMDTETEQQIQDALHLLTQGRTTIVIAHRLSTLKDCTRLFAIEDGEIAEHGTHEELLAKKGIYYKLYTLQAEAMEKVLNVD